jgi:hypothetical protein
MLSRIALLALCSPLLLAAVQGARTVSEDPISTKGIFRSNDSDDQGVDGWEVSKKLFHSPVGYFIQVGIWHTHPAPSVTLRRASPARTVAQERASKQLPGPGQHFQFGALQSWETIISYVQATPSKQTQT